MNYRLNSDRVGEIIRPGENQTHSTSVQPQVTFLIKLTSVTILNNIHVK